MLIDFAIQSKNRMRERGNYTGSNGPKGAVIHYTAGNFRNGINDAFASIKNGINAGFTYLCIAYSGELVQAHNVLKWGYHAGESGWKVKLKKLSWGIIGSVSDDLIGIEMDCAGKLTKIDGNYYPWWSIKKGKLVPTAKPVSSDNVRYVTEEDYGCPTGYYQKYTAAQEDTLTKTLIWLYVHCEDFKLEYVLGHHEVSGELGLGFWRKSDPGGSLSMPMKKYREYLIENKAYLINKYNFKYPLKVVT